MVQFDKSAKAAFWLLALAVLLGIVGRIEYVSERTEQAAVVCQDQTTITTPTKAQCIANQLERNGDK